ncbi:NAD(P)/FAD-dependent oxidoreductase [Brevundimonas faecalis]|uniref:NAD(P)/FAD-dependent oxidoreductase n=1 Tax=Brevundimonas faecalis TaxID=947378 RepID=UPI003623CBA8
MTSVPASAVDDRIVVIGAGHAGGAVAGFLRQYGHQGPIALIGHEPLPPYQRPPLSKAWLKGEVEADDLLLKPLSWYAENHVDLMVDTGVTAIDRVARTVATTDGRRLPYDQLILAMGARARSLSVPGAGLPGVLSLRTAADAEALKQALAPGRRLVVVGGGYVGLEAAASARALGVDVVLIERETRLLARVASEPLSRFFHARHTAEGVEILNGVELAAVEGDGKVEAVLLSDGRRLACDAVLIGVGALPNDDLARACGMACADGVIVDSQARTDDPAVFAIGDVTRRPLPHHDLHARLESVPSALEQAKQAAAAILGRPAPAPETPWFWSDQYDLKLQIAGLPHGADRQVTRGAPSSGAFAVFHLKGDRILAVEAVNSPAAFMGARALIGAQAAVVAERLADPDHSMKAVAA